MKKFLLKALDCQPEELGSVGLLLTVSFFIGIYIVTFDVGSSALFINNVVKGKQQELALGFTYAGILGVITAYIFVTLQKRIPFTFLVRIAFTLSLIYVTVISVLLFSTGSTGNVTENELKLIYLAFASLGPLNAISILSFYGIVTRAFDVKNQKRLTGTVDQGQMFATSIAFFTIPLIQEIAFFGNGDDEHFLFVSAGGLLVSLILLNIYFAKFKTKELTAVSKLKKETTAKFTEIAKNPYIRLLSVLFFFSVAATFFVEFSFLTQAAQAYSSTPQNLASFLGFYGGVLTLFSLILQVFFGDNIITTYGVKVALLIMPILLALITIISALVGTIAKFDATLSPLYFFILIS